VKWQRDLEAAGVRLHPGGHHVGMWPLSEKAAAGWYDRDGFFTDDRCEEIYQLERREERAWREEVGKLTPHFCKRVLGLVPPVTVGRKKLDREEILSRADIEQLIPPVRRLRDYYLATAFCHDDKRPSMTVWPAKKRYHCFVCGGGGTIYDFIMQRDNVPFIEAMKILDAMFP
jgi:hypothetical protein